MTTPTSECMEFNVHIPRSCRSEQSYRHIVEPRRGEQPHEREPEMKEASRKEMRRTVEKGSPVSAETALDILQCAADEIPELLAAATAVRKRSFGNRYRLCSILNAKSGACSEDCAFCAQSAYHQTGAEVFDMVAPEEIAAAYEEASDLPVSHFGIVTSGKALPEEDIERIAGTVRSGPRGRVAWYASLGCLDEPHLRFLKASGFTRFHHNLECAESFFPNICTTHGYELRIDTIRAARQSGLEVCSGGILGMGENLDQRVEFALCLAREKVESIPLNYLVPIPGTALESLTSMRPLDIVRSIGMFRMTNPGAEIKVCAGRVGMRDLQSLIFYAGATGMMMGTLLTVAGRNVQQDLRMIDDLELSGAEFLPEVHP